MSICRIYRPFVQNILKFFFIFGFIKYAILFLAISHDPNLFSLISSSPSKISQFKKIKYKIEG